MSWEEAQDWELNWWGTCGNTFGEETKQLLYAEKMGLQKVATDESAYNYNVDGARILDIGGGPVSLLLKCLCLREGWVVDPLLDKWPKWVTDRYLEAGIIPVSMKAEDLADTPEVDEVWIYNVLEHTDDPERVIRNAQRLGKLIRIFEWINTPPAPGHPHTFTEAVLNEWLHGEGKVERFSRGRVYGDGYYGIFPC